MLIVHRHGDCALLQITFVLFVLYYVCYIHEEGRMVGAWLFVLMVSLHA